MPTWTKARSELAVSTRQLGRDHPKTIEKHREMRALRAEEYVRRLLEEAPPLTDEQRTRLVELLRPARKGGAA